jgi:predicted dehydrogenase
MSSPVRCAVIGLGMGSVHAKGFAECPESRLVAVADLDAKRLEKYAGQLGKDHCYRDYRQMLKREKPDVVGVALPNFLHAPVTIEALRSGAHVLCEKPMAMNVKQARGMIAAARKAKRLLGINLSYRFTPQAKALKDVADSGALGKVYHAYTSWTRRDGFPGMGGWFGRKAMSGGGPLIDLGVHRLDMAMWLMGGPRPVSVSGSAHYEIGVPRGKAQKKAYDVEDFACGFIRFDTGASLVFRISWGGHQADPEEMCTAVMGTAGALVHRNEGGGYNFVAEFHTERKGHKLSGRVLPGASAQGNAYGDFVKSVVHGAPFLATAEDGLRVQQVLDGLYQSAAAGREVRVGR